jgi:hypothetical protein
MMINSGCRLEFYSITQFECEMINIGNAMQVSINATASFIKNMLFNSCPSLFHRNGQGTIPLSDPGSVVPTVARADPEYRTIRLMHILSTNITCASNLKKGSQNHLDAANVPTRVPCHLRAATAAKGNLI